MNRVLQPRPLIVLGLNVWMGTAAGDARACRCKKRSLKEALTSTSKSCLESRCPFAGPLRWPDVFSEGRRALLRIPTTGRAKCLPMLGSLKT